MESNNKQPESKITLIPKVVPIGTSVLLMDIAEAVRFFPKNNYKQLLHILALFNVPIIYQRDGRKMFNLYTLEKVMSYLTRLGGRGFALPGSTMRDQNLYEKAYKDLPEEEKPLKQIGEHEISEMNRSKIVAESMATGPRATEGAKRRYTELLRSMEMAECQNPQT
jgi:hypothetical protein